MPQQRIVVMIALVLASCSTAAQSRQPRVAVTNIEGVLLNDKGVSIGESTVTYLIEFLPANATRAEIQLLRDREPLVVFPLPLKAGVGKFNLPSGLQMENPNDYLTAQLQLPDGKWSDNGVLMLRDKAEFEERDRLARARFERLEPDLVTRQTSPRSVRLIGSELAPHVDKLDTTFWQVEAQVVGNALRFAVPDDAFEHPGFHTISSRANSESFASPNQQHVVLAVADPRLPKPGGFVEARVDGVEFQDGGQSVLVKGVNFRPRMKIVFGRGDTPIEAHDSEMYSTRELRTYVPQTGPGDDYFIAVLSADGTAMTKKFPISSPARMRAATAAPVKEKPRLTPPGFRIYGDVAWNTPQQWLFLEGPVAKPGLQVRLKRGPDEATVEAVAATGADASGREHPVVRVPVPPAISRKAVYTVQIVLHTK